VKAYFVEGIALTMLRLVWGRDRCGVWVVVDRAKSEAVFGAAYAVMVAEVILRTSGRVHDPLLRQSAKVSVCDFLADRVRRFVRWLSWLGEQQRLR